MILNPKQCPIYLFIIIIPTIIGYSIAFPTNVTNNGTGSNDNETGFRRFKVPNITISNETTTQQSILEDETTNKAILLNSSCTSNFNCSSIEHSFCGFQHELNDSDTHVCRCKDGYSPSLDSTICIPLNNCTNAGFNSQFEQNNCPDEKQFCRENRCLCKANYAYDNLGKCQWNVPNEPEPNSNSTTEIDLNEKLEKYKSNSKTLWIIVIVLGWILFLGVVALVAVVIWKKFRKQEQPQEHQQVDQHETLLSKGYRGSNVDVNRMLFDED